MHKLALIGKNLSHSKSKEVYENLLGDNVKYTYLDYSSEESIPCLSELLKEFDGISVTSPYKKYISTLVKTKIEIRALESVNCVRKKENTIIGTNTDYLASLEIIKRYSQLDLRRLLIIGDGSMSKVIQKVCKEYNLDFDLTSRKIDKLSLLKNDITKYSLVVNACSREFDLSSFEFNDIQKIWDINYGQTYFVRINQKYKERYTDGRELLELQAKFACKYWEIN